MEKNKFKIDFIGVGFGRSASSWIFNCLKEHPQICTSSEKETKFFSYNYTENIDDYKKYFSHCSIKSIKGEYTPGYIYGKSVGEKIKKFFPEIKIIICLRDPIDRLRSLYYFNKQREGWKNKKIEKNINKDIKKFLKKPEEDKDNLIISNLYFKYLKNYFEIFEKEKILILFFEDIKTKPEETIEKLYNFLEVKNNFYPSILKKRVNYTAKNRRKILLINKLNKKSLNILRKEKNKKLLKLLKNLKINTLVKKVLIWNVRKNEENIKEIKKINLEKNITDKLKNFYKEDKKNIEILIGKKINQWS